MPRRYITVEEQQQIIERAKSRCEYCQCPMAYSAQPFVFEHIIAVVQALLYNPRHQQWQAHFAWSDDYLHIIGLTPTGRATVEALKLNRAGVINIRRLLRLAGHHPFTE